MKETQSCVKHWYTLHPPVITPVMLQRLLAAFRCLNTLWYDLHVGQYEESGLLSFFSMSHCWELKKKKPLVCAGVRVWSGNGSWLLFFPCMVTARAVWDSAGRPGRGKTRSVNVRKGPPLTCKQRSWPADDFNRTIYFCAPSPALFPEATRWCYPETWPNGTLAWCRPIVHAAKMAQGRRETIKRGFVLLYCFQRRRGKLS